MAREEKETCLGQGFLSFEQGVAGIELLIVLATLGVLIGIVAMSLDDMERCARNREISAEMRALQVAIDMYNTRNQAHGAPPIPAQKTPVVVSTDDPLAAPYFQRYLSRSTKFRYTWEAGGARLQVAGP